MAWCQRCWLATPKRQREAIGRYMDEDLCKEDMDKARAENGDPPLEETKWGPLFIQLAALPIGGEKVINPKPEKPDEYANRIRAALGMSKITNSFKWSVRVDGIAVVVTKRTRWTPPVEQTPADSPEPELPEEVEGHEEEEDDVETHEPPKARWEATLERLKKMDPGTSITLTPDIDDARKYASQLRSMVHNRGLYKIAHWGFDSVSQPGKIVVTKDREDWTESDREVAEMLRLGKSPTEITLHLRVPMARVMELKKEIMPEPTKTPEPASAPTTTAIVAPTIHKPVPAVEESAPARAPGSSVSIEQTRTEVRFEQRPAPRFEPAPHAYGNSTQVRLKSTGLLELRFTGEIFRLSDEDRRFVFGLVERLKFYEEFGGPEVSGNHKGGIPRSGKGEKLITIQVPESFIDDAFAQMSAEDRAHAIAAWLRDDPAVVKI